MYSIRFIYDRASTDGDTFYKEMKQMLFSQDIDHAKKNLNRKIGKGLFETVVHFLIFYIEVFYFNKKWTWFNYFAPYFSFMSLSNTIASYMVLRKDKVKKGYIIHIIQQLGPLLFMGLFFELSWGKTNQFRTLVWIFVWTLAIILTWFIYGYIKGLKRTTKYEEATKFMEKSLTNGFTIEEIIKRFGGNLWHIDSIIKSNKVLQKLRGTQEDYYTRRKELMEKLTQLEINRKHKFHKIYDPYISEAGEDELGKQIIKHLKETNEDFYRCRDSIDNILSTKIFEAYSTNELIQNGSIEETLQNYQVQQDINQDLYENDKEQLKKFKSQLEQLKIGLTPYYMGKLGIQLIHLLKVQFKIQNGEECIDQEKQNEIFFRINDIIQLHKAKDNSFLEIRHKALLKLLGYTINKIQKPQYTGYIMKKIEKEQKMLQIIVERNDEDLIVIEDELNDLKQKYKNLDQSNKDDQELESIYTVLLKEMFLYIIEYHKHDDDFYKQSIEQTRYNIKMLQQSIDDLPQEEFEAFFKRILKYMADIFTRCNTLHDEGRGKDNLTRMLQSLIDTKQFIDIIFRMSRDKGKIYLKRLYELQDETISFAFNEDDYVDIESNWVDFMQELKRIISEKLII